LAPTGETETPTAQAQVQARILVAEDYPTNRDVVQLHLESVGHEVVLAVNGREAVEQCRREKYDLVFMDVQMPEMDGLAATREIRATCENYDDVPIVALTANAEIDTKLFCLEAGMNDVVTKPIRRDLLIKAINAWLAPDEALADGATDQASRNPWRKSRPARPFRWTSPRRFASSAAMPSWSRPSWRSFWRTSPGRWIRS
jgi:CheY-like chemotaxis protein